MIAANQQDFHRAKNKKKKQSSKRRSYRMIDQKQLVDKILGIPHHTRIDQVVSDLCDEFRSGGYDADEFDSILFDPDCHDLRDLPPAILEARELPPPFTVIFEKRFCLFRFNRRLIHAGDDPVLIAEVERAFERTGISTRISDHSSSLQGLARSRGENGRLFFQHVVCGRHRSALCLLRDKGPVEELSMRDCLDMVLMQTLLFCARDLQVNASLIHQAVKQPIPELLPKVDGYIQADGIQTIFRPMLEDAELCLSEYKCPEKRKTERAHRIENRALGQALAEITDPDPAINLKQMNPLLRKRLANLGGRDLVKLRNRLDVTVPAIGKTLAAVSGPLSALPSNILGITKNGQRDSSETSNKTAVATRYSGLTPVECLSVGVCRFIQSVSCLASEFETMAQRYESDGKLFLCGAYGLPAFDFGLLPYGSHTTVRSLVDHYRFAVLQDSGLGCKSGRDDPIASHETQGQKAIDKAVDWLGTLGRRELMDFEGDINSERRTFHLLDILPEVRLSR